MKKTIKNSLFSGKSAEEVAEALKPLLDFKEAGISLEQLSDLIQQQLVPHLLKYDHPGFFSMFNAYPEEGAHLGADIALAFNQGVTNWQVSPGGAMLEELCARSLCQLFDLAETADATFMYSGTYANQQAVYMALHKRAEERGFDLRREGINGFRSGKPPALAVSCDAHFSLKRAAHMLGIGENQLISVAVDGNRRMDTADLNRKISESKNSHDIFMVVATAGTTSSGSIDPIAETAAICHSHGIWLHVDGAYGLAYSLIPEYRSRFTGLETADSVTWDPHKQMAVPIPNSVLFVRNGGEFSRMTIHSEYFNLRGDPNPNPGLKSAPTTRPMSVLPLVCSILHQGLEGLRNRLRHPLIMVERLAESLNEAADIDLLHSPDCGILCFRLTPEHLPAAEFNRLQEFIYRNLLKRGSYSLSITRFEDKVALRLLTVSCQSRFEDLEDIITQVRRSGAEYLVSGCKN